MSFKTFLAEYLLDLEHALKEADMWSETQPSIEALTSESPFCVDALKFEEWCQWIFIPQLTHMLENPSFVGLPNRSDTATMADFVFSQRNLNHKAVKEVIKKLAMIDASLNSQLPTKH